MKDLIRMLPGLSVPPAIAEGELLPESVIHLQKRTMKLCIRCRETVSPAMITQLELQLKNELNLNEMKLDLRYPDAAPESAATPAEEAEWGELLSQADAAVSAPPREDAVQQFEQEQADRLKQYTSQAQTAVSQKKGPGSVIYGKTFKGKSIPLAELGQEYGTVIAEGSIFKIDKRETRRGMLIYTVSITDLSFSINCKLICDKTCEKSLDDGLKAGEQIIVKGDLSEDKYDRETVIMIRHIMLGKKETRKDLAEKKRVELHLHTQMSAMDAIAPAGDLVKTAISWGHPAIAITDHGVLQSFPLAFKAAGDSGIKIIYGVEAYLVNDTPDIVSGHKDVSFDDTFIVFDLETTGLSPISDEIIEIGAVKLQNGKIVDTFSEFVNPGRPIPANIVELTGITDAMVESAPDITQILPRFLEFSQDGVMVAHNASFDMSFLREACRRQHFPNRCLPFQD